jgi:hypothetical protein
VNLHAAALRFDQAGFGLEECDVHRLRLERRVDDMRGARERRVHVSARERRHRLQHVRRPRRERVGGMHERRVGLERLERIGERLEHVVLDRDPLRRFAGVELRVGDDDGEEVRYAAGELALGDEDGLVRVVQALAAETGNVGGGEHAHDARHREGVRRVDPEHPRARVIRHHHRAVQHPGDAHVVDERLLAERL